MAQPRLGMMPGRNTSCSPRRVGDRKNSCATRRVLVVLHITNNMSCKARSLSRNDQVSHRVVHQGLREQEHLESNCRVCWTRMLCRLINNLAKVPIPTRTPHATHQGQIEIVCRPDARHVVSSVRVSRTSNAGGSPPRVCKGNQSPVPTGYRAPLLFHNPQNPILSAVSFLPFVDV